MNSVRGSRRFASCWTCQVASGGPEPLSPPQRLNPVFLPALKRFHGPLRYHKELEDIQRENLALGGEKAKPPWKLFADRSIRWQLIAVICLTMGQQLSGINAVSARAPFGRSLRPAPAAGRQIPRQLGTKSRMGIGHIPVGCSVLPCNGVSPSSSGRDNWRHIAGVGVGSLPDHCSKVQRQS